MSKYEIKGTTDSETSCFVCGKTNLKKTYILKNIETGKVIYVGCDCAAKLMKKTEKFIKTESNRIDEFNKWYNAKCPCCQTLMRNEPTKFFNSTFHDLVCPKCKDVHKY
jgi:hypothetical protein